MIRAIIFDVNGVIADDETPHLRYFEQALASTTCRSRRMTTTART
jgi:beta-phosphoglucomutase-like phosphatase (HAD superfamily)